MSTLEFFLAGTLSAATIFLLAALGELVAEKSGVLNLSVEGMMAVSAATVTAAVTFQALAFVASALLVILRASSLLCV